MIAMTHRLSLSQRADVWAIALPGLPEDSGYYSLLREKHAACSHLTIDQESGWRAIAGDESRIQVHFHGKLKALLRFRLFTMNQS
jgi:hypothetical protein